MISKEDKKRLLEEYKEIKTKTIKDISKAYIIYLKFRQWLIKAKKEQKPYLGFMYG